MYYVRIYGQVCSNFHQHVTRMVENIDLGRRRKEAEDHGPESCTMEKMGQGGCSSLSAVGFCLTLQYLYPRWLLPG